MLVGIVNSYIQLLVTVICKLFNFTVYWILKFLETQVKGNRVKLSLLFINKKGNYEECLHDVRATVELQPDFIKAMARGKFGSNLSCSDPKVL